MLATRHWPCAHASPTRLTTGIPLRNAPHRTSSSTTIKGSRLSGLSQFKHDSTCPDPWLVHFMHLRSPVRKQQNIALCPWMTTSSCTRPKISAFNPQAASNALRQPLSTGPSNTHLMAHRAVCPAAPMPPGSPPLMCTKTSHLVADVFHNGWHLGTR